MMEDTKQVIDELSDVEINYPGIVDRVKAAFTDSLVVIALMWLLANLFNQFDEVPVSARVVSAICVWILYDPLFTSFSGGTIGHKVMRLEVKRISNQEKNIILPLAMLRFLLKVLLGWISLLSVGANKERLALHDLASGSIVLRKTEAA